MRPTLTAFAFTLVCLPLAAQRTPRIMRADSVEGMIKQATEQLDNAKKGYDRDIEVLAHVRAADHALVDPMQPTNAVEKAWQEIGEAHRLQPPFDVMQGVLAATRVIEDARRSPTTADFGHLRAVIRDQALGPASRQVVRNATRLHESMADWIKIQQMISDHLRLLADTAAQSLRASEQN